MSTQEHQPLEMFDLDFHNDARPPVVPIVDAPERDEQGRMRVDLMTGRELLEEMVTSQRALTDALNRFVAENPMGKMLESNPMLKMLFGGNGKR